MSTKYNTKHPDRNKSKYPARLRKRSLTKAPSLEPVEHLRARQERRVRETCTLGSEHGRHVCNGVPWPVRGQAGEEAA